LQPLEGDLLLQRTTTPSRYHDPRIERHVGSDQKLDLDSGNRAWSAHSVVNQHLIFSIFGILNIVGSFRRLNGRRRSPSLDIAGMRTFGYELMHRYISTNTISGSEGAYSANGHFFPLFLFDAPIHCCSWARGSHLGSVSGPCGRDIAQVMTAIEYKGYRIEVSSVGKGWRAAIFAPGSTRALADSPSNLEKSRTEEIIAQAKRIIDARFGPRSV
jgi:hypothetical protein